MPLGEHERPATLLAAVAAAALLGAAVLAGALTSTDLASHGGSLPGGIFIAAVLGVLSLNMYRRRYWAVLSFEALLAFQLVVSSLGLVIATSLLEAGVCLASIVLGGTLFWKLVRVMGRIQAGERARAYARIEASWEADPEMGVEADAEAGVEAADHGGGDA